MTHNYYYDSCFFNQFHVFHDYIRFYEVLQIEEALEKTLKF
jgi:hypothetical protein